jgi:glycosyltransferase involved in cell wall biosynthesis
MVAKYLGAKSILTDHCAAHPSHPNAVVRTAARLADFLSVKLIFPFYDSITVVSEATKQFVLSHGVKNANVISGGVNPERFSKKFVVPKSLDFLKKTAKNMLVISFIGRLIPAKGLAHFVAAAQQLATLNPNVLFVIAGDGELFKSLQKAASHQIKIVGSLDETGVTALLAKTDILVHPSTHHEGLPLTVLEAGAAGCAVVATPTGQVRQLLGRSRGVLCEPSAVSIVIQLLPLIKNRSLTKKLGKNLQSHILATYTWPRSARKFKQLISSLS